MKHTHEQGDKSAQISKRSKPSEGGRRSANQVKPKIRTGWPFQAIQQKKTQRILEHGTCISCAPMTYLGHLSAPSGASSVLGRIISTLTFGEKKCVATKSIFLDRKLGQNVTHQNIGGTPLNLWPQRQAVYVDLARTYDRVYPSVWWATNCNLSF